MYGAPALKVHGKLLACIPSHRSAEADSLAVRVDCDDRAELLAEATDVYYVTDHYLGYRRSDPSPPSHSRGIEGLARHGLQICNRERGSGLRSAKAPRLEIQEMKDPPASGRVTSTSVLTVRNPLQIQLHPAKM